MLALWLPANGAGAADGGSYAPSFSGKVVKFGLSGFEPDFDPIYDIVIQSTLHDGRAASAVPDAMLVLSMYLESFKPDTTPILPDILHPNQTAVNIVGFLQGKAALVSAGGHIAYRGSLLAEIFHDNTVHIIVNLHTASAMSAAPPLQLRGVFTLYKGGTEAGSLRAAQPLGTEARTLLVVPHGPAMSWQAVVSGLSVPLPKMMGTMGSSATPHAQSQAQARAQSQAQATALAQAQTHPQVASPPRATAVPQSSNGVGASLNLMAPIGAAVVVIGVGLLLWRRSRQHSRSPARSPR